ncbi:hypothetical protein EVAR_80192_1 [Eumeta japonica]|uniref:Uncharacterized protein n=1 Tax=Eumeta variegata TaxID=151549 RepID=A0A4C1UC99_EUMVA|nr:hypothetical protein EVAR_80192_1 [Eumeta japonica]
MADSENDDISRTRNSPDLIPFSNVSVSPLQTNDKIRVTSGGRKVDSDPKSLVGPKNFALSVNYDGKLMQLQLTPGNKNNVRNVKNILSLSKKNDIEPNNAAENPVLEACDYSISLPILPSGVHLVLLPNQQVMPYVEYGCNLSENELKDIQYIIFYVQNQLNEQKNCEIKYPLHNESIVNTENSILRELNVTDFDNVNTVNLSAEPPHCTASMENNDNDTVTQNKQSEGRISHSKTTDTDDLQTSNFQKDNSPDHSVKKVKDVDESTSDSNLQTLTIDTAANKSGTEGNSNVIESNIEDALIFTTSSTHTENLENDVTNHELLQTKADSEDLSEENHENQAETLGKIKIKQFASLSESFPEVKDVPERHNIGKTSILSDLMEMSGISSEDVLVSPEKCVSTSQLSVFKNTESLQIPQTVNQDDTELSSMLKSNDGLKKVQTVPIRILTSVIYEDSTDHDYSIESTDKMQRLVPIQKPRIIYQVQKQLTHPHSVIDVDSDDEAKIMPTVNRTSNIQVKKGTRFKKSAENNLTTIIVEKKTPSILCHSRSNSIRSKIVYEEQSQKKVDIQNKLAKKRKRKDCLKQKAKVEAKIDLLDSDAPMEEEYLVDSFDSDSDMSQKNTRTKHKQRTRTGKRNIDLYNSSSNESMSISTNLDSCDSSSFEKYLYTTGDSEAEESNDSSIFTMGEPNRQKTKVDADCYSFSNTKPKSKRTKEEMKTRNIDSTSSRKIQLNRKQKKKEVNDKAPFGTTKDCAEKRKRQADENLSRFITFKNRKEKGKIETNVDSSPLSVLKLDTENNSNIVDTDSSDDEPLAKKILRKETQRKSNSKSDDDINIEQIANDVKESVENNTSENL